MRIMHSHSHPSPLCILFAHFRCHWLPLPTGQSLIDHISLMISSSFSALRLLALFLVFLLLLSALKCRLHLVNCMANVAMINVNVNVMALWDLRKFFSAFWTHSSSQFPKGKLISIWFNSYLAFKFVYILHICLIQIMHECCVCKLFVIFKVNFINWNCSMSCSKLIADSGNQFHIVPLTFSVWLFFSDYKYIYYTYFA